MMIGYARVSTDEQNLDLRLDVLNDAGCESVFVDNGSRGWHHAHGVGRVALLSPKHFQP